MRRLSLLLLFFFAAFVAKAQVNHVVISQVYGGGGNSGATYSNDFVELFNPTTATINLSGFSIQYASATGVSWINKVNLTGSIAPGKYFLLQLAAGSTASTPLPLADQTGGINMSATNGKVALVNSTIALTGSGCPIDNSLIIDFVGYGSTADCREGSNNAPAPGSSNTNTLAIIRKNSGCTDNNQNSTDFTVSTPIPRNSQSLANSCSTVSQPSLAINDITLDEGNSGTTRFTFTVSLSAPAPAGGVSFTIATADGTAIADGDYVAKSLTSQTIAEGNTTYSFDVVVNGDLTTEADETFLVNVTNVTGASIADGQGLGTIINDDAPPTVSVTAGTDAAEPSTNGTFLISLSNPAPVGGVTITYAFSGTATAGTDYNDLQSGTVLIAEGTSSATFTINPLDDNRTEGTETIILTLTSANTGYTLGSNRTATINLLDNDIPKVVINQVYGGGGNSGATFTHDFIELYNTENFPVNLSGWSVQYNSAAGTNTWQKTDLNKTIPARGYLLIQQAKGNGGTTALPTPDVPGTIAIAGTAGKVLLSSTTTALTGANPTGSTVVDKVGYGSNATGFETAPAPGTENATSVRRITDGVDTDDNSKDFIVAQPEPRNSTYTTAAPAIVSVTPPDNATDLPYNIATKILFDKPVQKGGGSFTFYEDGAPTVIDVNSSLVTVEGRTVAIAKAYAIGKSYSITIDAGAFKDVYENSFAGISDNTTWNFSIYNSANTVSLPAGFDFQNCTGNGLLPQGFTQFSQTGDIVWDCTTFGRDAADSKGSSPYAVQISGFANGTNVPNVDWLISPAIDLTGTTFPLLSFWSRAAFNGLPLQLKVSTDYPGTGDPRNYTWKELNGKFPEQGSNEWKLSDNINLSAYKQPRVYIAFVYTSTDDDGARWTLDDISIENSATPPPPSLTVSAKDVQFNYVAGGATGVKTFTLIGNDITGGINLTATGPFQLSKDGLNFNSAISFEKEEANDLLKTISVQFAPTAENQTYSGAVSISTSGLSATLQLKGTSIDPATTLEVVNWNIEWFGHLGNGPGNEDLQEQNVVKIMKNVDADVYGLMEIVDEAKLARVVAQLPGYAYTISNYGSHTNTSVNPPTALADAQKLAFVYKTSVVANLGARAFLSQGINTAEDVKNPYYNHWSSGRFPYMMNADVTLGGVTKNVKFILVHAKANTSPVNTSYQRRKAGADVLHDSLRILFPNDNLVIFGDFNDDLDQSITEGFTTTSWDKFTTDGAEYSALTLLLSEAGFKSTVSYNDIIDHVVVSNEMNQWYMNSTASIVTDVTALVSSYGSTTSDHYPVFTRYMFCKLTPPADINVGTDAGQCGAVVNYTLGSTMTCGTVTSSHPSGTFFPVGTTTVTLEASTGETASFNVTVTDSEAPVITPAQNIVVLNDEGKCSATVSITLPAVVDNCTQGLIATGIRSDNKALNEIYPVGITTITWKVADANGNEAIAKEQTVTVEDREQPVVIAPVVPVKCYAGTESYTIAPLVAGDNCGIASTSYAIAGATTRTGSGANASGQFNVGVSTITWTVKDAAGNEAVAQTIVTINSRLTSVIPDVYAVNPGGAANTLYTGYGPSSLTLKGEVSGGTAPYYYKWTIGSNAGSGVKTDTYTINPHSPTTYYFNVDDVYGCSAEFAKVTINVVDVRCGPKMDKVTICQTAKGKTSTNCVAQKDVASALAAGAYLGSCVNAASVTKIAQPLEEQSPVVSLRILASPNPAANVFNVQVMATDWQAPVQLRVTDLLGRTVEVRNNVLPNSMLQLGAHYKAGVYLIEIAQGEERRQLKLIKK